ncbi:MAG: MurR/RpiR family transcriptional regulator [Actinomycetes bacterium]|jgi:DNA-binding MurR/RpiR family transcriptional regulator
MPPKRPASSHTSPKYSDLVGEIKNSFSNFHASEALIAQAVIDDPAAVAQMNISKLAEHSVTSVSSVVRFAKTMGFKGYPEFRMALVGEISRLDSTDGHDRNLDGGITLNDTPEEVIRKIAAADALAIKTTAERLDSKVFVQVVDLWSKANTIATFGLASSGYVAMDLQLKLNRLGISSIAWRDAHSALTSISLLKKGDVLVAISHSGTTVDVIDVISEFKSRGIKVILITNGTRSPAAGLADFVLFTSARETTFRSGATASRIAQLTVVDCLCVALAQRSWKSTKLALEESRSAVASRSGKK